MFSLGEGCHDRMLHIFFAAVVEIYTSLYWAMILFDYVIIPLNKLVHCFSVNSVSVSINWHVIARTVDICF